LSHDLLQILDRRMVGPAHPISHGGRDGFATIWFLDTRGCRCVLKHIVGKATEKFAAISR